MTIALRQYQEKAIDTVRASMRQHRATLLVSPTGSGKTVMFSFMAGAASSKGKRVYILCHREELVDQIAATLAGFKVAFGIIAAGYQPDPRPLVQVASVFSLARRLDRIPAPDLIIVDEAHHAIGKSTWGAVLARWPAAKVVGVTATPCRLSGEGLAETFQSMVLGPTVSELTELGALCPYRLFAPATVDLSQVHTRGGDYAKDELSAAMDKASITGDAIGHYKRLSEGKRAVVFCVSVAHAQHVEQQFRSAGYRAMTLEGTMDRGLRRSVVRSFGSGELQVLTSCSIVTEGFDIPAIETVILLRPTQSLSLYLQMVGRGLRPYPGKDHAIILDHAGNSARHGLPDDPREWTLEGRAKRSRGADDATPIRTCPKCFAAMNVAATACKFCGHIFEIKERELKQIEGDLVEVDPKAAKMQRRYEQGRAQTLEDLVKLGHARGMRSPLKWAGFVWAARQRKQADA